MYNINPLLMLTIITIIVNILYKIRWLQYLLIYIIIGGNYIHIAKKQKFRNKLDYIIGKRKYNGIIHESLNILLHLIIPCILLYGLKEKMNYLDWLKGLIFISLYGIIIDVKKYYFTDKKRFILSSILLWTLIYNIINFYF
tara:strand:- start:1187 stop:1609 length:423 start_codon:yes stop_codon:yes gene_type:complete